MSALARPWVVIAAIIAGTAAVLMIMGHPLICECGTVRLWHGQTVSAENSQHLTDWYTPSHVLHGLLFYAALHRFTPWAPICWRLVIATVIEAAWEIGENTPAMIERYRSSTIALDYFGDSVLNSVADIGAMLAGFALARRLPVWASVMLFLAAEAITTTLIRDGLILNVLMLLWPLQAVRDWQSGL